MSDTVTLTREQWDRILIACAGMSHPLSDLSSLTAAFAFAGMDAQAKHVASLYKRINLLQIEIENVLRETTRLPQVSASENKPNPNKEA